MRASDRHLIGISAVLATALAAVHLLRIPAITVDDAYISYRYADQLLRGNGLVFNPGERVEGFSNFLWVMLIAAGGALRLDPVAVSRAIGGVCVVLTILVTIRLTWRLTRSHAAAWAAGMLPAASTALCASAMSGLETPLYGLCVTLGADLFIRRRPAAASFVWGLAAITRPEGAALWIVAIACFGWHGQAYSLARGDRASSPHDGWHGQAYSLARGNRIAWSRLLLPCALMLAALVGFRLVYYDEWLPNSVTAKSVMLPAIRQADWADVLAIVFNAPGLLYITGFVMATVGLLLPLAFLPLAIGRTRRLAARYLFAIVTLGFVVALYNFGDWMTAYRLLTPYLPSLAVLVTWGTVLAMRRLRRGPPAFARVLVACVLVALIGVCAAWQREMPPILWQPDEELATVLEHSRQERLFVATDLLGRLGYFAPSVRVLDMAGLTDPHIARHGEPKPTLGKWDLAYVLAQEPHLLLTNTLDAWGTMPDSADFGARYVWIDDPAWRPGTVPFVTQRYVFVRRGSRLQEELRFAYPDAAWRDPAHIRTHAADTDN